MQNLSLWGSIKKAATSDTAKDLYAHAGHAAIDRLLKEQQLEELSFLRKVAGGIKKAATSETAKELYAHAGHALIDRYLSPEELEPSDVVSNRSRPGMSLLPGVPSTCAIILAPFEIRSEPSAPAKRISPNLSPSWTIVFDPIDVPRDLPKTKVPASVEFEYAVIEAIV